MITPITPHDADRYHWEKIPGSVVKVINLLIQECYSNGVATVSTEVIERNLINNQIAKDRTEIYDNGWLEIEGLYREAGWHVEFVPHNKTYFNKAQESLFIFKKAE